MNPVDVIVIMLGITEMEAEQVDKYAYETGMYQEYKHLAEKGSVADAKGFFTLACDEYRRANNIQTKSL